MPSYNRTDRRAMPAGPAVAHIEPTLDDLSRARGGCRVGLMWLQARHRGEAIVILGTSWKAGQELSVYARGAGRDFQCPASEVYLEDEWPRDACKAHGHSEKRFREAMERRMAEEGPGRP